MSAIVRCTQQFYKRNSVMSVIRKTPAIHPRECQNKKRPPEGERLSYLAKISR